MPTSGNSTRKDPRAPYTHCKPPKDCFTCKYSDCVAGLNKKTTREEQEFYTISGNRINMRGAKKMLAILVTAFASAALTAAVFGCLSAAKHSEDERRIRELEELLLKLEGRTDDEQEA